MYAIDINEKTAWAIYASDANVALAYVAGNGVGWALAEYIPQGFVDGNAARRRREAEANEDPNIDLLV